MPRIDPNTVSEPTGGGASARDCGGGSKSLVPVAYIVRTVNTQKGPREVMDVGFVCIKDYEEGNDEGSVLKISFWLTDASLWVLNRLCDALGNSQPYDTDSDADMGRVFALGAVRAMVSVSERQGEKRTFHQYEVSPYDWSAETYTSVDPTTGAPIFDEASTAMIRSAEEHFARRFRPASASPAPSNGGYSGSTGGTQGGGYRDDDIPF